jgi:hypothetical protein
MRLIVENLHPYTSALFLDQFGNYVVQCCLRFGPPWTNFIFESMMEKLWEIAQGRFGARAMRACLESHSATKEQQVCTQLARLIPASISRGDYPSQCPTRNESQRGITPHLAPRHMQLPQPIQDPCAPSNFPPGEALHTQTRLPHRSQTRQPAYGTRGTGHHLLGAVLP